MEGKGHPTNAQLQYDGSWEKGLSVTKINYINYTSFIKVYITLTI